MNIYPILKYPNKTLRQVAIPILTHEISDAKAIALKMVDTMRAKAGCGLAAPQVGINKRIIVVDHEGFSARMMANPQVTPFPALQEDFESCLSIPGKSICVKRHKNLIARFINLFTGKEESCYFDGFIARIIQHEIDHLDGKLIIDYEK